MSHKTAVSVLIVAAAACIALAAKAEVLQYDPHGRRDPLVPLVGAEKPAVTKLSDITSVDDIRLEGIVSGAKGEMAAMLNGELINAGDKIGDITVKSISSNTVVLSVGGKEHKLKLSEEGGQ